MRRIRLLLVDDHPLFREGLARLLGSCPEFEVVGQCGASAEALQWLHRRDIDLVLLDFDLGDEPGNQFLASARESGYEGKVLIVTAGMTAAESSAVLKLGALGIVLKQSSLDTLSNAIRRAMEGETWVDQKVVLQMAERFQQASSQGLARTLTEREDQVLRGVFEGLANKEIAAKIGVSESSVKATLQQLFDKTGVRTRSQLVRIALEGRFRTNKEW